MLVFDAIETKQFDDSRTCCNISLIQDRSVAYATPYSLMWTKMSGERLYLVSSKDDMMGVAYRFRNATTLLSKKELEDQYVYFSSP